MHGSINCSKLNQGPSPCAGLQTQKENMDFRSAVTNPDVLYSGHRMSINPGDQRSP